MAVNDQSSTVRRRGGDDPGGDFLELSFRRSSPWMASENVGKGGDEREREREGASNRKSDHEKEMGGGHAR